MWWGRKREGWKSGKRVGKVVPWEDVEKVSEWNKVMRRIRWR